MFNRRRFIGGLFGSAAVGVSEAKAQEKKFSPEASVIKSIADLKGDVKLIVLQNYNQKLRIYVNPKRVDYKGDFCFECEDKIHSIAAELRILYPKIVILLIEYFQEMTVTLNEEPPLVVNGIWSMQVENDNVVMCMNLNDTERVEYKVWFDGKKTHKEEIDRWLIHGPPVLN